MKHLSPDQLAQFREGALAGAELLAADDHLATCDECCENLGRLPAARSGWVELAAGMRAAAGAAEPHVSYEHLQAYVDGTGPQAERARLESHLAECEACRREARDLQAFSATLHARRVQPSRFARYLIFGPVAAVLLAAVLVMLLQERPTPLTASLHDGGKTIGLDRQGRLVGVDAATGAEREMLLAALRDHRIAVTIPQGLRGNRSVLLGADAGETHFRVLSPVGELVLQDAPEFRWETVKQARGYRVQVFDLEYQPVMSSPEVAGTSWTPDRPLERGKTYAWQVTAMRNGPAIKAPEPPDAEARFEILDAADTSALEQARQASAGHLRMAALYAHAGLCREALAEMDALLRENAGSALVQQIRAGLASQCDAGDQR